MNRREFIGASLAAFVAALALSFEPFVAWWRKWLGGPAELRAVNDAMRAYIDAKSAEIDALYRKLGEQLSEVYWGRPYEYRLTSYPTLFSSGPITL